MRSRQSRASTASRLGTHCAKKSSRARCRSTRRSTSSSAAPPAAPPAARSDFSRFIHDWHQPRCTRPSSSATPRPWTSDCDNIRSSQSGRADRRTGSRCSTSATRPCTRRRGTRVSRVSLPSRAVSSHSVRIRTPSTTGTGIRSYRGRRCGERSAPSNTCLLRRSCSRPAPTLLTASPRTLPEAVAISMHSNCCTATA